MLKFKEYFEEKTFELQEQVTNEDIGERAQTLQNMADGLLGKRKHPFTREFPGEKVEIGKRGNGFYIKHGGMTHTSQEDVEKTHGENHPLTELFKELPNILPRTGGSFTTSLHSFKEDKNGNLSDGNGVFIDPDIAHGKAAKKAKFSLMFHSRVNLDGTKKPVDMSKLVMNPNVHYIDAKITPEPEKFTPEELQQCNKHMLTARSAFAKMKPDTLENLIDHIPHIQEFMNQSDSTKTPKMNEYVDYLTKIHKSDKNMSAKQKDTLSRKLHSLLDNIKKSDIHNALALNHGLTHANNVLQSVFEKQANNDGIYGHEGLK